MIITSRPIIASLFIALSLISTIVRGQSLARQIVVTDITGARIYGARITLESTQGSVIQEGLTNNEGVFIVSNLPSGSYLLKITASGFQSRQMGFDFSRHPSPNIEVVLSAEPLQSEVTVTATRGTVENIETAAQIVIVKDEEDFRARYLPNTGNALEGNSSISLQQSTQGQVSPFLRGLTGYHVLNLIDGIRFNNSTFRSGPNQYLAFVEPYQAEKVEALLGPASAQYGSDALGGAIQIITPSPDFSEERDFTFHAIVNAFAASADLSGGADSRVYIGSGPVAWVAGGSWRGHNDLRAGGGFDSHNVFRRFFGLSLDEIKSIYGSRLQDTGFSQYGWHTKFAARLREDQSLTVWYQQSDLERIRGYKDLWGGLGRMRSDFEPQGLKFFYARYEKLSLGWIDSLAGTFSINSQSDGSIRQGLRLTDRITTDEVRVDSFGYAVQATAHVGARQAIVFGGEVYDERIDASRIENDSVTNNGVEKRALYPDGSRYRTFGLFAQDSFEIVRGRLRAVFGGRFTNVAFSTSADRNLDSTGRSLGVVDSSQSYRDLTYNTSLTWNIVDPLSLHFLTGRGFRAPNLNDLGAQGLNDLGFEIPAEDAVPVGGLVGVSDGEGVLSSGKPVTKLKAERLFNYELGITFRRRSFYVRAQTFDAEFKDPIVRRTLLFTDRQVPSSIAGISVTPIPQNAEQRAQEVVSVATNLDPRAIKAFVNVGRARYYGFDAIVRYSISPRWGIESNYSYIIGREIDPDRFVRRLPPQQLFLSARYQPAWRNLWVELSGNFAGKQKRLSGGDLTDERIGAARRRRDITDFFSSSLVRPFIQAGPDGQFGTEDDRFAATGETVAEIRNRVLPLGATINGVEIANDETRVPLFLSNPGYTSLNLRAGLRLTEHITLNGVLMNFLDSNYRIHGSGVDAPGINFVAAVKYSF